MFTNVPTRMAGLLVAALLAASIPAHATNGMYLVGYGPETVGRGGANLAVSDRVLALNFNPAGIAQLQGNHLTASFSVLAPSMEFQNGLNGATAGDDRLFPLPALAWVRSGNESRWAFGVGLLAQGGMGATFDGLSTGFGNRDGTYTEIRFATMTPTVAWLVNEDMALGATLNVGWADASFRLFPETSFFNTVAPEQSFFGADMVRADGLQTNLRLGWWWRPAPEWSVGAVYQTETDSTYDDGEMTINFTNHPFVGRKVLYSADMDGFTFAAQAGVGVAWRSPSTRYVVTLDVKRYFWDDAIDTIRVTASSPSDPAAPPVVVFPFVFDWQDQWVVALGGDWRASSRLTLRGGLGWGENPVPDETLTPLFPATTEKHASIGAAWLSGNTTYEFAVERAFNASGVNMNPDPRVNPFGPGAQVDHDQWTVSFGASWAWARQSMRLARHEAREAR